MTGPHPWHHGIGAENRPRPGPYPGGPRPDQRGYTPSYPGSFGGQAAPPTAMYPPQRRRRRVAVGAVAVLALVAALLTVVVFAARGRGSSAGISERQASSAIQSYLDALSRQDTETIARNALCGMYDAVRERRSDDAVAKLNSDAFRKQFSEAEVTSIDKIVYLSDYQAQALFSMRVVPTGGRAHRDKVQGLAQLLATEHQVLVCSYALHAAAAY